MTAETEFDPVRILTTRQRHEVEFVLVGGLGARAHGAVRPDALIQRSVDQEIDGIVVHVAELDDIAAKEHADRDKDHRVLLELPKLREDNLRSS